MKTILFRIWLVLGAVFFLTVFRTWTVLVAVFVILRGDVDDSTWGEWEDYL